MTSEHIDRRSRDFDTELGSGMRVYHLMKLEDKKYLLHKPNKTTTLINYELTRWNSTARNEQLWGVLSSRLHWSYIQERDVSVFSPGPSTLFSDDYTFQFQQYRDPTETNPIKIHIWDNYIFSMQHLNRHLPFLTSRFTKRSSSCSEDDGCFLVIIIIIIKALFWSQPPPRDSLDGNTTLLTIYFLFLLSRSLAVVVIVSIVFLTFK